MDLRLQPKPEVEVTKADKGIISKKQYFVEKTFEEINQYCFPAHLIRNWKPKAQLIYPSVSEETSIQYECDFNRNVQNCFVEDYAEEVFLRTPPPCFVVIGKCGSSLNKLGQDIAKEYGSVLIQVDDIINQVIQTESETSHFLHRILRLGISLTLNFVLPLLSFLAHTPEARHRGYVLCGLPKIPELYDLTVEQQFNYLFTWDNKPTIFINVLFDDEDLIRERVNLRCETKGARKGKFILFHPQLNELSEDEDEVENPDEKDLLPIKEKTFYSNINIDISPSRPWVRLPRDEESQVWSELELFNMQLKPAIELITSRVDPQYFITVDSRVQNEFEIVRARLRLLQIWKSPIAFPLLKQKKKNYDLDGNKIDENEEKEDEEEEEEDDDDDTENEEQTEILKVAEESPQVAFLTLFSKKTISPKFLWELSHYNYICPVSLREGVIAEGKSAFAVVFMKYIYFLLDEECMKKFIQNPRAYVLPIRPKPLCRFIILGFPFTGKTTLANNLANEYSIPVLDLNLILQADRDRKKNIYQNFCKEKAECKEILRLTTLAWQDWRKEEEQRVTLIENWIIYIQSLLSQRLTQFYFPEISEHETKTYSPPESTNNIALQPEDDTFLGESKDAEEKILGVRGVAINLRLSDPYSRERTPVYNQSSASVKIIHAMKHEDFDFNEKSFEVEANLFFSSLWNTFSNEKQKHSENESEEGENDETQLERESVIIDWSKLLPAQSLSTLLMSRKPYTIREKRKSFQVLLEAASKNYWSENSLKSEFAKWRLPCFMDIPLCEIFLDNPILLLKYVPDWLNERPLIPDPVDPNHPSVIEAGNKAFARAKVVQISQNYEEVAILLRDAIEKAEKEGMRVTGEVISPGGWVLDNMTLDIDVWQKLACENIFADHIYILIDPDPEYRRILNKWSDLYCPPVESSESDDHENDFDENTENTENTEEEEESFVKASDTSEGLTTYEMNLREILKDSMELINQNEEELDEILSTLDNGENLERYSIKAQVDPFCQGVLYSISEKFKTVKVESLHDEATSSIFFNTDSPYVFVNHKQKTDFFFKIDLGSKLQVFTDKIMELFYPLPKTDELKNQLSRVLKNELKFFVDLLTLSRKLDQITEFLASKNRDNVITKIDITEKNELAVLNEINNQLMEPFIKKPRELEEFEINEIQKCTDRANPDGEEEDEELELDEKNEEKEDFRIFGESGSLCVVNLERNILLPGKPEFALRYYGKLYYFWNEEAKNKFLDNPEKYAPYYSAIRCYPPLRIFVMGPIGTGKTKLSHAIASQCSLNFVDYLTLLNKNLIPNALQTFDKLTALQEQSLVLREEHNPPAKIAKEQFMCAPHSYRTRWLECPFYSNLSLYKDIIDTANSTLSDIPSVFPELSYQNIEPKDENYPLLDEYDFPPPDPFISMNQLESMINKYIQNVSDLDVYCVDKSLKKLWKSQPYVTEGFVLEGFPMRAFDVKHMLTNNWIPDLIIELNLPEDILVENNIEKMMDLWDAKLTQECAEENLLEDTLNIIQRSRKWSKRDDLMLEMQTKVFEKFHENNKSNEVETFSDQKYKQEVEKTSFKSSPTQSAVIPPEMESQILQEIDKILEDEFPPLVFKTIFETYDAGKARLVEDLLKNYRRDVQEINKIKTELQDINIPWLEVNGEIDFDENLKDIFILLDKIKKRESKKGEFAFIVKMEIAEKLLEQGYYFLSKFGRWCPVQIYRHKNSIHMFRPLSSREKVVPIAYRNYMYFVAGENEQKKFMEDPIRYTFNEPHHPNIPVRAAVIGPPKSGKSTLCLRLGAMFGLKVVTMGTALRFVVENIPHSTLAKNVNNYLKRGCFLPLTLKIEALMACLNDAACVTQGFVLDGIPFDAAFTQSLAERGKLPFVIISLRADVDFGKTNRQNLNLAPFRLPYKNRVNLDMRYRDWGDTYEKFAQWNQFTYNNLYEINAKLSVVDIFYRAYDIIRNSLFGILYYVEYCVSDRALPLQYLCVSQHEYEIRKSSLENNCPVCWADLKVLCPSTSADPPERSGLFQYLANFYWVCPDHKEKFQTAPKKYLFPHAEEAPQFLPKIITKEIYKTMSPLPKIHGYGRCPVTRTDFPGKLNWEGSWDFAALYANKVYLCKDKEMLDRFVMQPWNYINADTIFEVNRPTKSKAVEELEPPIVTSLPPIGFLEQTVAKLIIEGLRIVGTVRPVYPKINLEATGCILLGLLLKSEHRKDKCQYLIKHYINFLVQNCTASNYISRSFKLTEEMGQGDSEPAFTESVDSEISDKEGIVSFSQLSWDSSWVDTADSQADKQMWSAKTLPSYKSKMKLTAEDELEEIPTHPKTLVVLKYQSYVLRHCPLPPIERCISYIYTAGPNMKLPEPFNYNSLYQPLQAFSSPYPKAMVFNPEKEFSLSLYNETQSDSKSAKFLKKDPRAFSARSLPEFVATEDPNHNTKLVAERFMPRFRFLDKIPSLSIPPIPKIIDEEFLVYNPQREYTYMMLYAEFFHMSHVLRCHEWSILDQHLELDSRHDKNLGFSETHIIHPPRKRSLLEMKRSIDFYHDTFDTCAKFVSPPQEEKPDDEIQKQSLVIDFIQNIILEKIYEIFLQLSDTDLSYDSFETTIIQSEDCLRKPASIFIREILPFPPLPWDIICRPYFAFASIQPIFNIPRLDNIAHERHFSLLDGVETVEEKIRFIRYPSWIHLKSEGNAHNFEQEKIVEKSPMSKLHAAVKEKAIYFNYDFFHLPWTSFLPYPFSWAYNEEITSFFKENHEGKEK